MAVTRIPAIFKKIPSTSLHRLVRFSSSSPSKPNPRSLGFYGGDNGCEEGSIVYKHKLQFQRPATVEWKPPWLRTEEDTNTLSRNSVSLIGRVLFPVRAMNCRCCFGVSTKLEVKSSSDSKDSFRIMLVMWEEMAEISLKYLKQNDFIYVSGYLGSFTKAGESGQSDILYKVNVQELNYVACNDRFPSNQKFEKPEPKEDSIYTYGAPEMEEKMDRLYLWQVFFASPHEWWDNRKGKKYSRAPDFKHKDTGEKLWLGPSDPPWVGRQLQRHDSRMAQHGYRNPENSRSRVSLWKYDEFPIS